MKTTLFTLTLSILASVTFSANAFAARTGSVSIEGAEAKRVFLAATGLGIDTKGGMFDVEGFYCSIASETKSEVVSCSAAGGASVVGTPAQEMIDALRSGGVFLGKPVSDQGTTVSDISLQRLKCIRQEFPVSDYETKSTMISFFCSATR